MTKNQWVSRVVKPLVFTAWLLPFARLVYWGFTDGLGANPVECITHQTGTWGLIALTATLAISPVQRFTGFGQLIKFRRMFGLFAFFYASLHLTTYLLFDHGFSLEEIVGDVIERPFVTAGFASFLLMVPLAITSTKGWIKRLGGKVWNRLHALVYVAAAAAIVHYVWLVKADLREPTKYGLIIAALLALRLIPKKRRRRATSVSKESTAG